MFFMQILHQSRQHLLVSYPYLWSPGANSRKLDWTDTDTLREADLPLNRQKETALGGHISDGRSATHWWASTEISRTAKRDEATVGMTRKQETRNNEIQSFSEIPIP